MSNTLCPFVFGHTHIEPNGDIKFCCGAFPHYDGDGKPYNVTTHTLTEAWNSETLKQTRMDMINGLKPSTCHVCWVSENDDNTKGTSIRLNVATRLKSEMLERLDYVKQHNGELDQLAFDFQVSVGNLCNLACKMCNALNSTAYQTFFNKVHGITTNITTYDWPVTMSLTDDIFKDHISGMKRIFLTGGEPTITTELIDFIDDIYDINKSVVVWTSTNCTKISNRHLNSLSKFDNFWMNLSLDGMGDIAYLQRTPSNWESIEKNVDRVFDWLSEETQSNKSPQITILTVITSLNLHHVIDFWVYLINRYQDKYKFWIGINLERGQPTPYIIEVLPKSIVNVVNAQLAQYRDILPGYVVEYMEYLLSSTNFSDDMQEFQKCLDTMQMYHPEKNIRQIYDIYYQ